MGDEQLVFIMKQKKKISKYFSLLGVVAVAVALRAIDFPLPLDNAADCALDSYVIISRLSRAGLRNSSAGAENTDMDAGADYKTSHRSITELSAYLVGYEPESPYICADITVSGYGYSAKESEDDYEDEHVTFTGDADIVWQFYDSLAELEDGLQERRENRTGENGGDRNGENGTGEEVAAADGNGADEGLAFRMLYYRFPLPEGAHALDVYEALKERYDTKKTPLCVLSGNQGTLYYITQQTTGGDGVKMFDEPESEINLIVKDGYAHGLLLMERGEIRSEPSIWYLFSDYEGIATDMSAWGWRMDEENLYWMDHKERRTVTEDGSSFWEVRGINEWWWEVGGLWPGAAAGFMQYFGVLKEADHEVAVSEGESPFSIHFSLDADASQEDEYTRYLLDKSCAEERYHMTVTDLESGRILQTLEVDMCVEAADTVTFVDLNADGCLDMRIDKPTHWVDRVVMDEYAQYTYLLWNPEKKLFEHRSAQEVTISLFVNSNGLMEDHTGSIGGETEYVVQSGDCLWSISERLLGSGGYWQLIRRAEDAPEDPDHLLSGETVIVPGKIDIP